MLGMKPKRVQLYSYDCILGFGFGIHQSLFVLAGGIEVLEWSWGAVVIVIFTPDLDPDSAPYSTPRGPFSLLFGFIPPNKGSKYGDNPAKTYPAVLNAGLNTGLNRRGQNYNNNRRDYK